MADRIEIPVTKVEFDPDGTTMWVQAPQATVLRIQSMQGFRVQECSPQNLLRQTDFDRPRHGISQWLVGTEKPGFEALLEAGRTLRTEAAAFRHIVGDGVEDVDSDLMEEYTDQSNKLLDAIAAFDVAWNGCGLNGA